MPFSFSSFRSMYLARAVPNKDDYSSIYNALIFKLKNYYAFWGLIVDPPETVQSGSQLLAKKLTADRKYLIEKWLFKKSLSCYTIESEKPLNLSDALNGNL